MRANCAASCEAVEKQALADAKAVEAIGSFFDLVADDIHGNSVHFSQFKDQVTIVVNVASKCGYTDDHYKQLVQLWSQVKSTGKVNILAFPCNQFGAQEPESNDKIFDFALGYGVGFQMMSKINVNGANASIVYKYLKKMAGPSSIGWNFATYYVVAPDGTIQSHSGVEPLELKELALAMLDGDEL
jgi:glutathione peroxidase